MLKSKMLLLVIYALQDLLHKNKTLDNSVTTKITMQHTANYQ